EDGIRDFHVTGVQTCALPILVELRLHALDRAALPAVRARFRPQVPAPVLAVDRLRAGSGAIAPIEQRASVFLRIAEAVDQKEIEIGRASCREREEGWWVAVAR